MSKQILVYCLVFLQYALSFQPKININPLRSYVGLSKKISSTLSKVNINPLKASSNEDEFDDTNVYTTKQVLKEETEAPFRNLRFFTYLSLIAAAGIGTFVSFTQLIAVLSGVRKAELQSIIMNLGVNLGGISVLAYLWKRDVDSQQSRLQRIQKGGSLAGLKVRIGTNDAPLVVKLSDLRRDRGIEKRVVIVAAPKALLESSILSSLSQAENLLSNDLLIIPIQLNSDDSVPTSFTIGLPNFETIFNDIPIESRLHIGVPIALPSWQNVLKREVGDAKKQNQDAIAKGVTIVIKKNGKVGSRRLGVPIWEALANDVQMRKEAGLDITNI